MEHYFTQNPTSELKITKVKTTLKNKEIEIYTASGLFSIKRIDVGTEILVNKAVIRNNYKILDLGCGYGIVGIALMLNNSSLKLTFSDINERAIKITKMNLDKYKLKAETIQSNGFENIKEKFDTILLNPPQTAGKELCFKLMEDSYQHLEDKGTLQIVARHNKGGKALSEKMEEIFGNVKELVKQA